MKKGHVIGLMEKYASRLEDTLPLMNSIEYLGVFKMLKVP